MSAGTLEWRKAALEANVLHGLSGSAMTVWQLMATDYANDGSDSDVPWPTHVRGLGQGFAIAWPGVNTIAKFMGYTRRGIQKSLDELRDMCRIVIVAKELSHFPVVYAVLPWPAIRALQSETLRLAAHIRSPQGRTTVHPDASSPANSSARDPRITVTAGAYNGAPNPVGPSSDPHGFSIKGLDSAHNGSPQERTAVHPNASSPANNSARDSRITVTTGAHNGPPNPAVPYSDPHGVSIKGLDSAQNGSPLTVDALRKAAVEHGLEVLVVAAEVEVAVRLKIKAPLQWALKHLREGRSFARGHHIAAAEKKSRRRNSAPHPLRWPAMANRDFLGKVLVGGRKSVPHIEQHDLESNSRLLALFDWCVRRGIIGGSEADRFDFVAEAMNCRRCGKQNPAGMFARRIRN